MKNRDKQLKVGLVPTRREAFANETTTRQKEAVVQRFRQLADELDFTIVDIEDINEEGMPWFSRTAISGRRRRWAGWQRT